MVKPELKPHEVPMIPAVIKMLLASVNEQMSEQHPDWEWVIANLKEAHDAAVAGCEHAQKDGDPTL